MMGYWTESVLGIILIASPWVLGFSDVSLAKWCNVLVGLALTLMGAWAIFGEERVAPAMEESQKGKQKLKTNVE
jgi:hypothetical protein